MALDERLRRELDRAARPADPSGVYEHLIRRRERRRIAGRVQAGALGILVVLGSVGGFYALTRVFRGTDEPPIAAPGVSNGQIVFSLPLEGEGEHLFAIEPDGSGLRRLTPEGRTVYRSPDVSPDGRTVVVVHEIPSFERGQSVLATIPIEGGTPTWLTEEPHLFLDPAWSPNGDRIAFAGSLGGPYGVYVLDVATGEIRLVRGTDEISVGDPTWSPDGSVIAFEGSTASDTDPSQTWDIYSVRLDGSGLTNLTNTPDASETWPSWSWANDRIAFVRGGGDAEGLSTIARDGSDERFVFADLPALGSPAWSPDGTRLAFAADTGQIYTIGANGTDLRPVTGALGEPAWQAIVDGEPIAPTPTPRPAVTTPPGAEDIGLGFPVCDVTSVAGVFAPGIEGRAFVATRAGDTGGCPTFEGGSQVLAVDVTGDGLADGSYGPLTCDPFCSMFATLDIDGNGTDELLVQNVQFSIAGLKLYVVGADAESEGARIDPVVVGTGSAAFESGTEPQFWLGGDAGNADAIRCEPRGERRVFVSVRSYHPIEGATHIDVVETTFNLKARFLSVVEVDEFTWRIEDESRPFLDTGGCGTDLETNN